MLFLIVARAVRRLLDRFAARRLCRAAARQLASGLAGMLAYRGALRALAKR